MMKTRELNNKDIVNLDGQSVKLLTKGIINRVSCLTFQLQNGNYIHIEAKDPDIDLIFIEVKL